MVKFKIGIGRGLSYNDEFWTFLYIESEGGRIIHEFLNRRMHGYSVDENANIELHFFKDFVRMWITNPPIELVKINHPNFFVELQRLIL